MSMVTILLLLVLMFAGYVLVIYKKLLRQNTILIKLNSELKVENNDTLRRKYNAIARDYNHNLSGFIGKQLAKKLKYAKKEIIEKKMTI